MLHMHYRIKLTEAAENDLHAFWQWVQEREKWFYDGLDMVLGTQWYVRTIGEDVHALEHVVTFADAAAWGDYRAQVGNRSQDPAWERRRTEQNRWWRLQDAALLSDPPVAVGFTRNRPAASEGADLP